MKKHLMLARIFSLVLIVLESLPGVVLVFPHSSDGSRWIAWSSYFNPATCYPSVNFGQFYTAVLSVLLAAVLIVMYFYKNRIIAWIGVAISFAAFITTFFPLFLGIDYMGRISWCIMLIFVCECVLLYIYARHMEK